MATYIYFIYTPINLQMVTCHTYVHMTYVHMRCTIHMHTHNKYILHT